MAKKLNYIICFDFETGGLDPKKHAVTQIAMEVLDPVNLSPIAKYESYVLPYSKPKKKTGSRIVKKNERDNEELYEYTEKALDFTNITMDLLDDVGKHIEDVCEGIVDIFKKANPQNNRSYKPILLGQNVKFDIGFLQQISERCGIDLSKYLNGDIDFYGNFQPTYIDTLDLSKQRFAEDKTVTSHKLGLMCNKLDIELVNAHEASADVRATSEIFKIYMESIRNSSSISIDNKEKTRNGFHFKM